jgi:hypothetical protein
MTFMYQSGEQIRSGDRIEYAGALGMVEFVITGASDDPSMNWYIEKFPRRRLHDGHGPVWPHLHERGG